MKKYDEKSDRWSNIITGGIIYPYKKGLNLEKYDKLLKEWEKKFEEEWSFDELDLDEEEKSNVK